MTRRIAVALLLLLPIAIGLGTETTANATTITTNPNNTILACHLAFTSTSGTWATGSITVDGDCNSTALLAGYAPGTLESGCVSYWYCSDSTSYDVSANAIFFYWWQGTYEIQGYIIAQETAPRPGSAAWDSTNVNFCGFYGNGDVAVDDTPTSTTNEIISGIPQADDTAASTALRGDVASDAECSSAQKAGMQVYVGVNNAGTTNYGTSSALWTNNGYCSAHYPAIAGCSDPTGLGLGLVGTLAPTSNDDVAPDCDLVSVTGNASEPTQAAGISYDYSVTFGGAADYIVAIDDAYTGTATTIKGKSFDLANIADVDPGRPHQPPIRRVHRGHRRRR